MRVSKGKTLWNIQQEYDFPDVWLDRNTLMSAFCHATEAGTRLERKMGWDAWKREKWKLQLTLQNMQRQWKAVILWWEREERLEAAVDTHSWYTVDMYKKDRMRENIDIWDYEALKMTPFCFPLKHTVASKLNSSYLELYCSFIWLICVLNSLRFMIWSPNEWKCLCWYCEWYCGYLFTHITICLFMASLSTVWTLLQYSKMHALALWCIVFQCVKVFYC